VEVTPISPPATPTRTGVRIHTRFRIDRIFLNHHRAWLKNHRSAYYDGLGKDGSPLLDDHRPCCPALDHDRSCFPLFICVNFMLVT
jgi:hypothetical protein